MTWWQRCQSLYRCCCFILDWHALIFSITSTCTNSASVVRSFVGSHVVEVLSSFTPLVVSSVVLFDVVPWPFSICSRIVISIASRGITFKFNFQPSKQEANRIEGNVLELETKLPLHCILVIIYCTHIFYKFHTIYKKWIRKWLLLIVGSLSSTSSTCSGLFSPF